jgi:hypothetical protein
VIPEQGEPRWNDTNRENLLIRPPELSGNSTSSHIVAKQERGERNTELILVTKCLFRTLRALLTCRKILRHGTDCFTFPPKGAAQRIIIALKNPIILGLL